MNETNINEWHRTVLANRLGNTFNTINLYVLNGGNHPLLFYVE